MELLGIFAWCLQPRVFLCLSFVWRFFLACINISWSLVSVSLYPWIPNFVRVCRLLRNNLSFLCFILPFVVWRFVAMS